MYAFGAVLAVIVGWVMYKIIVINFIDPVHGSPTIIQNGQERRVEISHCGRSQGLVVSDGKRDGLLIDGPAIDGRREITPIINGEKVALKRRSCMTTKDAIQLSKFIWGGQRSSVSTAFPRYHKWFGKLKGACDIPGGKIVFDVTINSCQ